MKRIIALTLAIIATFATMAKEPAVFKKGEFIGNLGVGVGVRAKDGQRGATFTQKGSFEYGLHQFGEKGLLSIGFAIANSYGNREDKTLLGTYDYEYEISHASTVRRGRVRGTGHRKGYGTKDVTLGYDDIKLFPTATFHYNLISNLDLFATIGAGLSIMNCIESDGRNYSGFEAKSKNNIGSLDGAYSYDDKKHAIFEKAEYTKVGGAFALNIGARYYFSQHWAVFSEFGITAVSLKKKYPRSWDLFNVGCTYKF